MGIWEADGIMVSLTGDGSVCHSCRQNVIAVSKRAAGRSVLASMPAQVNRSSVKCRPENLKMLVISSTLDPAASCALTEPELPSRLSESPFF